MPQAPAPTTPSSCLSFQPTKYYFLNPVKNVVQGLISVNCYQYALLFEIFYHRLRHYLVKLQPVLYNLGLVVIPQYQRTAAVITNPFFLRGHIKAENPLAFNALPPRGKPFHNFFFFRINVEHKINLYSAFLEEFVEHRS